jgi:hypothetical protein
MDERNDYNSIPMQLNKTAVDYIIEQLWSPCRGIPFTIIEQAKQMEKEQIINAHGLKYSDITEETVSGEDYYNQTYNNENTNGTSSI